jgi:vacuolar protein sorting-associated protein VTA1
VPDAGEPSAGVVQEEYFPPTASNPEPFIPSPLSQSPGQSASELHQPPAQVSPVPSPDVPVAPRQIPPQPSPQIPTKLPSQFAPPPPPETSATATHLPAWDDTPSAPPSAPSPAPVHQYAQPPVAPSPNPVHPAPPPPAPRAVPTGFTPNHKSMEQAQKHARWAISALNFDDVPTAVQELRNALQMLGAQ